MYICVTSKTTADSDKILHQ